MRIEIFIWSSRIEVTTHSDSLYFMAQGEPRVEIFRDDDKIFDSVRDKPQMGVGDLITVYCMIDGNVEQVDFGIKPFGKEVLLHIVYNGNVNWTYTYGPTELSIKGAVQ